MTITRFVLLFFAVLAITTLLGGGLVIGFLVGASVYMLDAAWRARHPKQLPPPRDSNEIE